MKFNLKKCLALCAAAVLAISSIQTQGIANVKAQETKTQNTGFVTAEGTQFMLNGHPFYFEGCNSYDLFTLGDGWNDSTTELICSKFMDQKKIEERFRQMAENGVTVLRTWGFSSETWHGFETAPGKYNEAEFMQFDYIMYCAQKYNIKVIITLENFWDAYGGIDAKLDWAGLSSGDYKSRCEWFTNEKCQTWYKNYIKHFTDRVNYFTGETYKDDPDIFAWDLMNEPRYQNFSEEENASGKTLRKWADASAAYLKSQDPNHMVCAGIEGHEAKYGFGGNEGNPFVYLQQSPYIDFCSAHPYPSEGWAGLTPEGNAELVRAWIKDAHEVVGKPIIIGEFNAHNNLPYEKYEAYWRSVYDTVYISKVVIRYYYDKTSSKPQIFSCDSAGISTNCAPYYQNYTNSVKGTFYDKYLEITFEDVVSFTDGNLTMGTRFYQNDWSGYENFKAVKMEVLYDGEVVSTEAL